MLKGFSTCMTFFLLWNRKENILRNVSLFLFCFLLFSFVFFCYFLFFSCFVLFCFLFLFFSFLFCFVLFCFVLFCFVLLWLGLVWFGLALLCFALICFFVHTMEVNQHDQHSSKYRLLCSAVERKSYRFGMTRVSKLWQDLHFCELFKVH